MTDTPQATAYVNNGSRPLVEIGDYDGEAGFVQKEERKAQLAYIPNKRGPGPDRGKIIEVENKMWRVVMRESSQYVRGMVVLTLELEI